MCETTWGCEQKVRPVGFFIAAQVHYASLKKKEDNMKDKIFSLTLNKGIVKSTFPFHIILFLYEHLVVRTDVHNDPEQIQRAS